MKKITSLIMLLIICLTFSACEKDNEVIPEIATPVEMDEQVLYDKNDIIIKAKKLKFPEQSQDYSAYYYYEVINNSDTDIFLTHLTFDVNGLSLHTPHKEEVVKKGETLENNITLNRNCCEWNDIRVIKEISFNLKIEACHVKSTDYADPDDASGIYNYEVDSVIEERTGDLVAKTKCADEFANYEQKIDKSGVTLFENESTTLIFKEVFTEAGMDGVKNLKAFVYIKNDYDFPISISYTAKKINGEEIPNEGNTIEIPFNSEGFRYWWESKIDYEKIESMDFTYTVKNLETEEVLMKTESLVTLNFDK